MTQFVIYHSGCMDGFAAAASVSHTYPFISASNFIPMHYGNPLPDSILKIPAPVRIFIVDFSLTPEQYQTLHTRGVETITIDHHETAKGLADHYDANESGATLTWRTLQPPTVKPPEILQYVRDRDLWLKELPSTEEVSLALYDHFGPYLNKPDSKKFREFMHASVPQLIKKGAELVKIRDAAVVAIAHKAFIEKDEDGLTRAHVSTCIHISEVGHYLCAHEDIDYAMMTFERPEKLVVSLRSKTPDGVAVNRIALKHGGGGHKHAAGYTILRKNQP